MLETAGAGLRPLTTTAIVDAACEHVRDDPVLYYGITAPVTLPLAAVAFYFWDLVHDYRGDRTGFEARLAVCAGLLVLFGHLRFVAQGAVAWAIGQRLQGLETSVGEAWWVALRRAVPLVFVGVCHWAAVIAAATLVIFPAFLIFPVLALGTTVAVQEKRGNVGTCVRAAELGWREIGRGFAIGVILSLGLVVLALGVGAGVHGLLELAKLVIYLDTSWLAAVLDWRNDLYVAAIFLSGLALLEPVKSAAFALLYVDRRVRTEGFDLRRKVQLILDAEKPPGRDAPLGPPAVAAEPALAVSSGETARGTS